MAQLSEQRRIVQDKVHRGAVEVELSGDLTGFDALTLTDRRAYSSFGLFVVHCIIHDVRALPLSAC